MDKKFLNTITNTFEIEIGEISFDQISQGFINDTFLVRLNSTPKYILQRINANVFKNVKGLHNNIEKALEILRADDYRSISLIQTKAKTPYYIHDDSFWRLLSFIPDSVAHNITSNKNVAFEAGRIVGKFHVLLKDENPNNYVETVTDLNFLPFRIEELTIALKSTSKQLIESAESEIAFANLNDTIFNEFYNANLPKRVCHNDTKLNNILFNQDDKALCLIDLDTIMSGHFHYDFGDAVRTVVSEANEDEKDLSKIGFNLGLFQKFIEGINSNGNFLTQNEIDFLPISCALLPFMHGLRALTDFLNGNIHYKVAYPQQNLDRCKSLFQFAKLALENQKEIKAVVNNNLK